jgi:hypothetical protein
MDTQESLSLLHRFEPAHTSFSYTSFLVRKLGTIVGILRSIVNRAGDKFSVSHAVASQLISDDFPRLISVLLKKSFEKRVAALLSRRACRKTSTTSPS